jgi:hypothetical protein
MVKSGRDKGPSVRKQRGTTTGFPADRSPPRDDRAGPPYDPRAGSDERTDYPGRGPHDDDATRPVHILGRSGHPSSERPSGDTPMHSSEIPGESSAAEKASEPRR